MNKQIQKIKRFRQFLLEQIDGLTAEQLNKIPQGYNNNIIWNIAHLICAQQSICYIRAAQKPVIDEKYIMPFITGTKPDVFITEAEIAEIKRLFVDSIDQLQADYEKDIFTNYTPSPNILKIYGMELKDIDDALDFILYHEGFHSGYIVSLMRSVNDVVTA